MNKVYLYIKNDLELGAILEKVKIVREREIVLVVPEGTKALLHPTNLQIFRNEVEKMNKKVFISTDDEKLRTLALNAGMDLFLDDFAEQQIVDVKPPSLKKTENKSEIYQEEKSEEKKPPTPRKKILSVIKSIFIYLTLAVFMSFIFIVAFQQLQTKAEVIIKPERKEITLDEVIILNVNSLTPDFSKKELPAEIIKLDLNRVETITTTGKIFVSEQNLLKVIFLNYLAREVPLREGTRVVYQNNVFKTTERIDLPPAKDNEPGKIVVNALPFSVVTSDLTIPQDLELEIPGFKNLRTENGSLWTELVKAKVVENYSLGSGTKIGSVSPEDITNIKLNLQNSLINSLKTQLAIKYQNYFYIFDENLVNFEIKNISHQVGEKTDKLSATGKIDIETLGVNKKAFDDFIRNIVNKEILSKEEKLIVRNIYYEKINLLDFNKKNKTMTLAVRLKAVLEPEINVERIKYDIKGKSLKDAKDLYLAKVIKTGGSITIKIFPQWKDRFPTDPERIRVLIK
ncbi:MAG: hypothetical protein NZ822_01160 [Patescibacteria group bacterium]|nr:hypothetical protein [Patescibacteria group bacterium]